MPQKTARTSTRQHRAAKAERARKILAGVARNDSDDELGTEDHPWEWIYEDTQEDDEAAANEEDDEKSATAKRLRSKPLQYAANKQRIIGASMGSFKCKIGDTVLLKADGTNTSWVAIVCDFMDAINMDGEPEKQAKFMCKSPRLSYSSF